MRNVLIGMGFMLFLTESVAADPLTYNGQLSLNQAVARARDAGFDVRLAKANAEAALAQAATGRAQGLPQVGVAATALKANLPQLGMPVARQTYLSVNASVPIIAAAQWLGARANGLAGAGSEISVSEARNDAAYAVIQLYRRAQLADALVSARSVDVSAQQTHLQTTQLRVRVGKSPRYLLARDAAALAGARQNLEDAAAQRDESLNDLKAALDFSIDSNVQLNDPLTLVPFDLTQAAASARASQFRPALLAARRQLDAARVRVNAARAAYLPTVTGIAQTYNGSSSPNLGATGYQVGISANLPILDGGTRSAALKQALADLHRRQTQYEQVALFAHRDVVNAFRELRAASANLQTARAAVADAQEQLRIARLREAAGKGINLEVLDALAVAANARENSLVAIARYDNAVAGVQHATGDLAFGKEQP